MKLFIALALGLLTSNLVTAQRTSWPVVIHGQQQTNCTFPVEVTYCREDLNNEIESKTVTWSMGPGTASFAPILEGFETDGEFSPPPSPPVVSLQIGGVTLDASNPCACFNYAGGCCFQVCLSATHIEITYYDCSDPNPPCTTVHSF